MRKLILALSVSCAALSLHAAPSLPVPLVSLGEIHGTALGWIKIAMPVFDQQINGDIKAYAISVDEADDTVHVVFERTPVVRGHRGAAREGPGLVVDISKTSAVVTGSHLIR